MMIKKTPRFAHNRNVECLSMCLQFSHFPKFKPIEKRYLLSHVQNSYIIIQVHCSKSGKYLSWRVWGTSKNVLQLQEYFDFYWHTRVLLHSQKKNLRNSLDQTKPLGPRQVCPSSLGSQFHSFEISSVFLCPVPTIQVV